MPSTDVVRVADSEAPPGARPPVTVPAGALLAALRIAAPLRKREGPSLARVPWADLAGSGLGLFLDLSEDGTAVLAAGFGSWAVLSVDPEPAPWDATLALADSAALVKALRAARATGKGAADPVALSWDGGSVLAVTVGAATLSLDCLAVPALPDPPESEGDPVAWQLTVGELADSVARVAVAAGTDDTLPMLTNVAWCVDPAAGTVTLAATDRYRLTTSQVSAFGTWAAPRRGGERDRWLMPAWLAEALRLLPDREATVYVGLVPDGRVDILVEDWGRVVTPAVDGSFPPFASLIPDEDADMPVRLTLPRAETIADLKGARAKRGQLWHTVVIRSTADGYQLVIGEDRDTVIDRPAMGALEGADEVRFSPVFLADLLESMPHDDMVELRAASPSKPFVARDRGFTHLLMPVRNPS